MANGRKLFSYLAILAFAAVPFVVFLQRQDIMDWWRLKDYIPPAQIVRLADDTTMTDEGRKLFYVHRPELNERDKFNQNCSGFEQTIILGCYITNRAIYIFDVEDKRLNGIEQVTAGHEMLHAAYDRLSNSERTRIDSLTEQAYRSLNNQRVKKVIASYAEKDESVVPNELHSILATEVRKLPAELEQYYARYFSNRIKVVEYSEKYEAVFTRQQNNIKTLGDRIKRLENQLVLDKSTIDQLESELVSESNRLSQLRSQNKIAEYNAAVGPYNTKVGTYSSLVASYNGQVQLLNKLIKEYNTLATEQKKLINAINSHQKAL